MSDAPKSEAHRLIAEHVNRKGFAWVARKLGVSGPSVSQWIRFGRAPQNVIRARAAKVLNIPVGLWELPATDVRGQVARLVDDQTVTTNGAGPLAGRIEALDAPKHDTAPAPPPDDAHDAKANAIATLQILRVQLAKAEPEQAPKIANAITASSRLLARLSGSLEVTEAQILRSEPWQRLIGLVRTVLAKHPEAAKDLQKAMHELESR